MTPAVAALVTWCEELRQEGKLHPAAATELEQLIETVRLEDPVAAAFQGFVNEMRRREARK